MYFLCCFRTSNGDGIYENKFQFLPGDLSCIFRSVCRLVLIIVCFHLCFSKPPSNFFKLSTSFKYSFCRLTFFFWTKLYGYENVHGKRAAFFSGYSHELQNNRRFCKIICFENSFYLLRFLFSGANRKIRKQ